MYFVVDFIGININGFTSLAHFDLFSSDVYVALHFCNYIKFHCTHCPCGVKFTIASKRILT